MEMRVNWRKPTSALTLLSAFSIENLFPISREISILDRFRLVIRQSRAHASQFRNNFDDCVCSMRLY